MKQGADAKACCLVDNATIINACRLLDEPSTTFDVHKLSDLDTICQAILLNDEVRTLVGHSFMAARYGFSEVYNTLIKRRVLHPKPIRAGQVHYHIADQNRVDALARGLDLEPVISAVERVFADGIPWRDADHSPVGSGGRDHAMSDLLFGQNIPLSDSYPTYYFPTADRKAMSPGDLDLGRELDNRSTSWVPTFVAQTFYYLAEAAREEIPYYCSGVRVPVVAGLDGAVRARFFSVVHAALQHVERSVQVQVQEVLDFLGEQAVEPVYLPGLAFALRHIRSRDSFFDDLISLRKHPQLIEFRGWARTMRQAWQAKDIRAVRRGIAALRGIGAALGDLSGSGANASLAFIPKPDLAVFIPVAGADADRSVDHRALVRSAYDPVPAFLSELGMNLLEVEETRTAVERLIDRRLTDVDLNAMRALADARAALYSPGRISTPATAPTYQTVEITMGDRFENISRSTIVNRSQVESSFNRVRDGGDPAAAEALRRLADLVEQSGNANTVEYFDRFTEELDRPEPRRNYLKMLWDGLVAAMPVIKQIAGLADNITRLFT